MQKGDVVKLLREVREMLQAKERRPIGVIEACKYLDISKAYLYKLTSENRLACFKPNGKKIYFLKEDLDSWAFRHRSRTLEELRADAKRN